jgi:hypothetical protein
MPAKGLNSQANLMLASDTFVIRPIDSPAAGAATG